MNVMTVNGYTAKIEYDADLDMFRGEIMGLSGAQICMAVIQSCTSAWPLRRRPRARASMLWLKRRCRSGSERTDG